MGTRKIDMIKNSLSSKISRLSARSAFEIVLEPIKFFVRFFLARSDTDN